MSDVRGSGDYYELEHDLQVRTIAEVINELRKGVSCLPDNGTLYLYEAGMHNVHQREITPREWIAKAGSQDWDLRWAKGWPPLLSNLQISVEDPMGKNTPKKEKNADQSDISQYS